MKSQFFLATVLACSTFSLPQVAQAEEVPYMKRYLTEPNLWELGLFGGLMFPSSNHQLYAPELGPNVQQGFKTSADLGVRFAYFPLAFVGAELEAAVMPSELSDGSSGGLWAARGHVMGQLTSMSVTPFVLVGAGMLGASSNAMGSDTDEAFHFGVGAKAPIDDRLLVRLDLRDTLHRDFNGNSSAPTHSPELLLGLSFTPVRRTPDRDGDGFLDYRDSCPGEAGANHGCPGPDTDGDGLRDDVDECIDEKGLEPSGCPDRDQDGLLDRDDYCPDQAGPEPTGCPEKVCVVPDADGDGLLDAVDECPKESARTANGCLIKDQDGDGNLDATDKCPADPEMKNGFDDEDGCPDVLPEKIQKFSGVIKGIEFALTKASIKPASLPLLKEAAKVLVEYPALRVRIVGHTDDQGDPEFNKKLSFDRAQSVKDFLVSEGVALDRIEVRGAGSSLPIADNKTPAGKQKNRRIEFEIIEK